MRLFIAVNFSPEALAALLRARGFVIESRRFAPHVTLARRIVDELPPGTKLLKTPVLEHVTAASLMRSELGRGAPKYTELARVDFAP